MPRKGSGTKATAKTTSEPTEEAAAPEVAADQGIVFEDPPNRRGRGATQFDWEAHLAPVVENPNKWAKVGTYASASTASSNAGKLRNGTVPVPFGAGYWQFTTRRNEEDGTSSLYAMYLGDEEE